VAMLIMYIKLQLEYKTSGYAGNVYQVATRVEN